MAHRNLTRILLVLFCSIAGLCLSVGRCWAGGGPENVLLVVNQNSEASLTIANYYIRLRDIPPDNVLYLDWTGGLEKTGGVAFRDRILTPILKTIDERKLSAQIDYVVYSSDFPWQVNLQNLFPDEKLPKQMRPLASLNGATFLWPYVLEKSPALLALGVNWYVPDATPNNLARCTKLEETLSQGFRSRYAWQRGGKRMKDLKQGQRYFLSAMLGVTQGRGNTIEEVARYLVSAAGADGTMPEGTFYFMQNSDVRSKTRHACFEAALDLLRAEGAGAVMLEGRLPQGAQDVMGLMTGASKFDVPAAKMRILPGAICEHLTSFGGYMDDGVGQTPLSEFLRAGAAGASGTVAEPFAIQGKFPLPTVQLHYRRGCSLGEAFYQSVASPYQLLIVGDPLCQPWAKPPACDLFGLEEGQTVSGTLPVRLRMAPTAKLCEVYLDGVLRSFTKPGAKTGLDTTKMADGYHELRMVAVNDDPIETRGSFVVGVNVKNREGKPLGLSTTPTNRVGFDERLVLRASGPELKRVVFRQNSRTLGQADGPGLKLELEAKTLGRGPSRLQAVDPITGEKSPPQWVWVE
jgi:uncharacterized protein (TIGR03790 family)